VNGVRATVFGLDVRAEIPLSFLEGASASATGRRLDISGGPQGSREALGWPRGAELISEGTDRDGTVCFSIEAHPEVGYLLSGPNYGAHLLSGDGRRLTCVLEDAREEEWQRLLVAQVLPFAAVLNGLEVFHASAVVTGGDAVAFVGSSRSGKTSVALELCRLGAEFLADDVLALENDGADVVGHAGSPIAGVDHAEAERVQDDSAIGEIVGVNARERLVRMQAAVEPAPLAALFFLDRRSDGPAKPRFEPIADAKMLLGATFNFVLESPQRLRGLLDICALVAERRVERILIGPSTDAAALGAAVTRRLGETA
jgi:hypothetical protein